MAQINKGTTYTTTNSTVTVENLNAHVGNATLAPGAIGEQAPLIGNANPATDQVLLLNGTSLVKSTVVQALGGVTPSQLLNTNNNLSDVQSIATAKLNLSLNNVENKSSETIRSEITSANVVNALGYTPASTGGAGAFVSTAQLGAINGVATLNSLGKLASNQLGQLTSASQLALLGTTALSVIGAQPVLTFPLTVAQGGTGVTTSTGSGNVVFSTSPTLTSPTLTSPTLGTPTSGNLSNCTGINVSSATGTLPVANGGTGTTASTGTGSNVLSNGPTISSANILSPTLSNANLGTPTSGNLSNCTSIPVGNATGTLAIANGGTGNTTYSSGQLLIGNSSGTLTKSTLTAGSNVTVTNGSGTITIASTIPAATASTIGGIIPGTGFSMSGSTLNAILPKAIASFNGQFASTTLVNATWTKSGTSLVITYNFSGSNPIFYANNKIFLDFAAVTGNPADGIYTIASVSTSGSTQTITISSVTSTTTSGSLSFRYCPINSTQNIASVILGGAVASVGRYIVNFSFQFSNTFFVPVASLSTPGTADDAYYPAYDLNPTSPFLESRTTSSFSFSAYDPTAGFNDVGASNGIVVFGS